MALIMRKLSLLAFLLFGALAAATSASRILPGGTSSMVKRHKEWMAQYGKVYRNATEKEQRFEIFKSNMEHIESFNARKHEYWLGPNQFTDLTNEEFNAIYLSGYKRSTSSRATPRNFWYENVSVAATNLDWRSKGAVTPIKDQGQCGACWAFSSVAATEGINQIKNGKLISLSEQELIDCDVNGQNQGCNGGLMDDAFKFIIDNGGINTEINYPYKAADGSCNSNKESNSAVKISGFEDVPSNSEASLLKAVSIQPVSVALDGGDPNFQHYAGGIFTGPCDTELDHAVTAIGYGINTDGTKYWLLKNSWGTSWGDHGYIKMQRDIDAVEGLSMALIMRKLSLLAFLLFGALAAATSASRILPGGTSSMVKRHEEWMAQYGKGYRNAAKKAQRFEIFKSNMEHIESFNARKREY
ncbi:hypothetical protein IEQ34_016788 [Dendrobium chrysotoxum]|uniref:Uncharacterized protein n=1 Tax=Dendrobium chrysotoxum TaxID=161865 RepID=A0AAV7GGR0_DENCH|nr:hypothetical protein IEQ34_016788 [Dendrobium chrysotoxum]